GAGTATELSIGEPSAAEVSVATTAVIPSGTSNGAVVPNGEVVSREDTPRAAVRAEATGIGDTSRAGEAGPGEPAPGDRAQGELWADRDSAHQDATDRAYEAVPSLRDDAAQEAAATLTAPAPEREAGREQGERPRRATRAAGPPDARTETGEARGDRSGET